MSMPSSQDPIAIDELCKRLRDRAKWKPFKLSYGLAARRVGLTKRMYVENVLRRMHEQGAITVMLYGHDYAIVEWTKIDDATG